MEINIKLWVAVSDRKRKKIAPDDNFIGNSYHLILSWLPKSEVI